jgi:hypothetical protein
LPTAVTQLAVGEAQIVLVPPPAPHLPFNEAVVIAIVVALLLDSHTPVWVAVFVDVDVGALVEEEEEVLVLVEEVEEDVEDEVDDEVDDEVEDEDDDEVARDEDEVESLEDEDVEDVEGELGATTYDTPLTLGLAAHVES